MHKALVLASIIGFDNESCNTPAQLFCNFIDQLQESQFLITNFGSHHMFSVCISPRNLYSCISYTVTLNRIKTLESKFFVETKRATHYFRADKILGSQIKMLDHNTKFPLQSVQ